MTPKLKNPISIFDGTIPVDEISKEDLMKWLADKGKQWVFQLEKGENSGYMHWQLRVNLKEKTRRVESEFTCHWTPTHGEDQKIGRRAFGYVLKEHTRVDGPWSDKDVSGYIPSNIRNATLREFQIAVDHEVKNPPTGKDILVMRNQSGQIGKSFLANTWYCNNEAILVSPLATNASQMAGYIFDATLNRQHRHWIIVFDIPKNVGPNTWIDVSMVAEEAASQRAWEVRHTSKMHTIEHPTVLVFCNDLPDSVKWTEKRVQYYDLNEQGLTKISR